MPNIAAPEAGMLGNVALIPNLRIFVLIWPWGIRLAWPWPNIHNLGQGVPFRLIPCVSRLNNVRTVINT